MRTPSVTLPDQLHSSFGNRHIVAIKKRQSYIPHIADAISR